MRERRIEDVASVRSCRMGCAMTGSAERPSARIMNDGRKKERSIWNETKGKEG